MYMRTIEKLGLYASTHFKNGSDVKKCLKKIVLVTATPPVLQENATDNYKRVWEYHMLDICKSE